MDGMFRKVVLSNLPLCKAFVPLAFRYTKLLPTHEDLRHIIATLQLLAPPIPTQFLAVLDVVLAALAAALPERFDAIGRGDTSGLGNWAAHAPVNAAENHWNPRLTQSPRHRCGSAIPK